MKPNVFLAESMVLNYFISGDSAINLKISFIELVLKFIITSDAAPLPGQDKDS